MNISELKNEVSDLSQVVRSELKVAKQKIGDLATQNAGLRERLEDIESRSNAPALGKGSETFNPMAVEHKRLFENALRAKFSGRAADELKEFEAKAVTIGTGSAGGYAVPEIIGRDLEKLEIEQNPLRAEVRSLTVGTSDYKELLTIPRDATSGWSSESGTRSETATASLRECVPTWGELYAYPKTSEWALDDVFFSVQDWLVEQTADVFANAEATAIISGDGSNKPTGMLNTAPVSTADNASPLRAAAAYQFVPSAASPDAVTADSLIDTMFTLKSQYRPRAIWVMNSSTAAAVRQLKDSQNRYLWTDGLIVGQPPSLLGHRVVLCEQMEDIGANQHPIAFGDFRRGYLLVQRSDIRITVDQVTQPGFVKFYVRRRVGGIPLNNDAIKFVKTT